MGFRFQRRLTLFPGVRLNFSRNGISASFGPRGASVTVGPHGSSLNLGIPGTGLSYRHSLTSGNGHTGRAELPSAEPAPGTAPRVAEPQGSVIASAPVSEVTSEGLEGLKALIKQVIAERQELARSIPVAKDELAKAQRRLRRAHHWFFGLFLKGKIPERQKAVEAKEAELKSQEERAGGAFIDAEFALDDATRETFGKLSEAFEGLTSCARIWDIVTEQYSDRRVTRSSASRSLERVGVKFSVSEDEVLQTEAKVLRLQNANGADLLLYPGFLMMVGAGDMALIDLRDIRLACRQVRFVETEPVPPDAVVVDQTWAKVNKDGSPDRRFANNYRIPVAGYGGMTLKTDDGLNEEYQFSNAEKAQRFAEVFTDYQNKLRVLGAKAPPQAAAGPALPAPEGGPDKAAPDFTRKAETFLHVAQAVSTEHALKLLDEFKDLFVADIKSFNGGRSMPAVEQFANYIAHIPGLVDGFLGRVPGQRTDLTKVAGIMSKATRSMAYDVVKQLQEAIGKLEPEKAAEAEAQQTLKVLREAEAVLRK